MTFTEILLNLLSGFVGALLGSVITGGIMYWQAVETARHELRILVSRLGFHAKQSRGTGQNRSDPMGTPLLDDAVAAYHRYRALLPIRCWKRSLDNAWTAFQGHDPREEDPLSHTQLVGDEGARRAVVMLRFLGAPAFSKVEA